MQVGGRSMMATRLISAKAFKPQLQNITTIFKAAHLSLNLIGGGGHTSIIGPYNEHITKMMGNDCQYNHCLYIYFHIAIP